jgi:hypothetical protein
MMPGAVGRVAGRMGFSVQGGIGLERTGTVLTGPQEGRQGTDDMYLH